MKRPIMGLGLDREIERNKKRQERIYKAVKQQASLSSPQAAGSDVWFAKGVVWACAELIRLFDQPTMALSIFKASGCSMKGCAPEDTGVIKKHQNETTSGA